MRVQALKRVMVGTPIPTSLAKGALLFRQGVIVTNVPYHLKG